MARRILTGGKTTAAGVARDTQARKREDFRKAEAPTPELKTKIDVQDGGQIGKEVPGQVVDIPEGGPVGAVRAAEPTAIETQQQPASPQAITAEAREGKPIVSEQAPTTKEQASEMIGQFSGQLEAPQVPTRGDVPKVDDFKTFMKESLGERPGLPESAADQFARLREEGGVAPMEEELGALQAEAADLQAQFRQQAADLRGGVAKQKGVFAGMVSEAERAANERMDSLNRRINSINGQIQTKNSIINQSMAFSQQDYQNATQDYNNKFGQAMQLQSAYNQQVDRERTIEQQDADAARANLNTIYGLAKEGNLDINNPQMQNQIAQLEMQSGLPQGTFSAIEFETEGSNLQVHSIGDPYMVDGKMYSSVTMINPETGEVTIKNATTDPNFVAPVMGMEGLGFTGEYGVDGGMPGFPGMPGASGDLTGIDDWLINYQRAGTASQKDKVWQEGVSRYGASAADNALRQLEGPENKTFKSEGASNAYAFGNRMKQAEGVLRKLEGKKGEVNTDEYLTQILGFRVPAPNVFKNQKEQSYDQAQRDFVNAVLRKESGAAISESEFDNARKQYFPQPGDTSQTILQKRDNRETAIGNMFEVSGYGEEGTISDERIFQEAQATPTIESFKPLDYYSQEQLDTAGYTGTEEERKQLYERDYGQPFSQAGGPKTPDFTGRVASGSLGSRRNQQFGTSFATGYTSPSNLMKPVNRNAIFIEVKNGEVLGGSTSGNDGQCGFVVNKLRPDLQYRMGDTLASKMKNVKKDTPMVPEVGSAFVADTNQYGHTGIVQAVIDPNTIVLFDSNKNNSQSAGRRIARRGADGVWRSDKYGDEKITGFTKGLT